MDVRVESKIPIEVKEKASKELEEHGLSISDFIRRILSSIAKDGFPKSWEIPNAETISSINEAIDDMKNPHLKSATSSKEVEDLLK